MTESFRDMNEGSDSNMCETSAAHKSSSQSPKIF